MRRSSSSPVKLATGRGRSRHRLTSDDRAGGKGRCTQLQLARSCSPLSGSRSDQSPICDLRLGARAPQRLCRRQTCVGKSYFGAALADVACRIGHRALYTRVPRLLEDLHLARTAGALTSSLGKFSCIDVLMLDDFLLNPMAEEDRRGLLEVLADRYGHSSIVVASQLTTKPGTPLLETRPSPMPSAIASSITRTSSH